MLPNPRTPVGKRQQQRNNNVTTTQQQIHRNRSIACGEPSNIDVTLILHTSPRPLPRRLPETSKRVPAQPRPQNGSKSNVSQKEINCKIVLSFFWKSNPPSQMRPDEATRGHLASSGLIWRHLAVSGLIWPHLASSGFIWPHLASSGVIWRHLASSGVIWRHLASSVVIWGTSWHSLSRIVYHRIILRIS